MECWEDYIPVGFQNDLGKAVAAKAEESIVLSWQIWADKDSFLAAEDRMHADPRMDASDELPFDAKRLILGCFPPCYWSVENSS